MLFKPETKLYGYEIMREGGVDVMYVNYIGSSTVPSLISDSSSMSRIIDYIIESPNISRIVFVQHRNYVHDLNQVRLLQEIARIYVYLIKQENILSLNKMSVTSCNQCVPQRLGVLRYLLLTLLKSDPLGCYVETKRLLREEKINAETIAEQCKRCQNHYISLLNNIMQLLENTQLVKRVKDHLEGYHIGERNFYENIFRPAIVPNFAFTRLMASIPSGAEIVDQYLTKGEFDRSTVTILKLPNKTKYVYHLTPPEFTLDEKYYSLVELARNVLLEHKPKAEEFTDPARIRQVFFNVGRDLLQELAKTKELKINYTKLNKLAEILVRHTIGFGLVEVALQDEKVQDLIINSPPGQVPMFLRHEDYDECDTNIIPSFEDVDSWAAKFRMLSGRPLDEANPILDTELILPKSRSRVAIIQQPLSPFGLAYALRRHRDKPWTLPLFIKNRMLNPLAAGLLSFLIDGSRTMLIAGTRSSGKTSLLGSLLLEIMPKYRILTVEDTLELPADALKNLGYDILRLKVRAALTKESTEVEAAEGIRASLRLGDSCLIVGEVRSEEALALYEAMRIGALANVVAGTIHGASPYGVFDRVVNDLKVPKTSFKATDIIAIANPIKSPDGLQRWRRMLTITEVRKHWTDDPVNEGGFVELMKYDVDSDELKPTDDLINGESEVLKDIAGQVKGWAGNWDAVWDNIVLRAKIKDALVKYSEAAKIPDLMEARFIVRSNNAFHNISNKVMKDVGIPEGKQVYKEWEEWIKKEIKRLRG
ncbi:hypothetical protein AUJ10_02460 [Candidatus Pacearchaeota archaeon CG1_02_31_27]|nr:MAG: hypothetical protein AUJ10_02460 [Candidatus Pacearchaeota archaeon CG1_02_31_27]PIN92489.1 MAG: hypothetical protein COU55_01645 [Candidatus Pacearchaeota archaeon CG10_big_fil_rev_8_21_14_0_10_31_59]PIZ80805.1 MAG: hypothetical protein COX99_01470 [Candidatus Pacearchaeota archaeon CG_4_10_14_0_2_um_filter_31_10]